MRDSQMPSADASNNRTVIFLTIGASVIMAAALIILLIRRGDAPQESPPEAEPPPEMHLPSPSLVAAKPARPPKNETETETDSEKEAASVQKSPSKSGSKRRAKTDESTGAIDTKKFNQFINARFAQVKACYERRLKINSFLEGELDLNIGILGSGKVDTIGVNKDTVRDAQMLSCVKSTVRSWTFPKPEGGRVVIGKTFSFKKKGM